MTMLGKIIAHEEQLLEQTHFGISSTYYWRSQSSRLSEHRAFSSVNFRCSLKPMDQKRYDNWGFPCQLIMDIFLASHKAAAYVVVWPPQIGCSHLSFSLGSLTMSIHFEDNHNQYMLEYKWGAWTPPNIFWTWLSFFFKQTWGDILEIFCLLNPGGSGLYPKDCINTSSEIFTLILVTWDVWHRESSLPQGDRQDFELLFWTWTWVLSYTNTASQGVFMPTLVVAEYPDDSIISAKMW
jgi:hypothetical protein